MLVEKALVLRLALRSGGTLWAWDDTKPCGSAKAMSECAIGYLVVEAAK